MLLARSSKSIPFQPTPGWQKAKSEPGLVGIQSLLALTGHLLAGQCVRAHSALWGRESKGRLTRRLHCFALRTRTHNLVMDLWIFPIEFFNQPFGLTSIKEFGSSAGTPVHL